MPNITWQEPQIFAELLASNYFAHINEQDIPGEQNIVFVSPWISNVELLCKPGVWHQGITVGMRKAGVNLGKCIKYFCEKGWEVHVAVLKYGRSISGLTKNIENFQHEKNFLMQIFNSGASVYLCPDLHAKGLITPFAIITGATNFTHSGLYLQSQNSNYFPFNHPDYKSNRIQLMAKFAGLDPIKSTEELI